MTRRSEIVDEEEILCLTNELKTGGWTQSGDVSR